MDVGLRVAVFAAADKSSEVREGGNTLVKRMVEVRADHPLRVTYAHELRSVQVHQ